MSQEVCCRQGKYVEFLGGANQACELGIWKHSPAWTPLGHFGVGQCFMGQINPNVFPEA